ncbi:MAG: GGDEF domain-containing protein [Acidimicrobiia bacterium]
MRDRRVACSIAAGFAALIAGIVASVADVPVGGLVAGGCGFVAAIGATALGARLRDEQDQLVHTVSERDALRRELDALAAIFADEASSTRAHTLPLAHPPTEAIVDTVSGLLEEQHYKVLVSKRVAAARRALQPISIVMFQVDGLEGAPREQCDAAVAALGEVITATLRESDAACRIGATMASAILEDTAEAGAVWAAERIRGTLHQTDLGDALTISAGVACYPTHALSALELMDRAQRALDYARSQGRDRLEVASAD